MITNILLTGGGGFVAGNIIVQAGRRAAFHAIEQSPVPLAKDNLSWHFLDLRDGAALARAFETAEPDVVVHLAAVSDIDYCEAHPEIADEVNVDVTRTLAALCGRTKTRLIYFSSDSVFDGRKGGYGEQDSPAPVNHYARTKVAAEQIVRAQCANWVIIRPSLIMGLPVLDTGNSFLWRMIKALKQNRQVAFPRAEIRSPVDAITLSRAVLELAENDFRGVLHISGNDVLTRFEMAARVVARLGYPAGSVIDAKPDVKSGRARRPRDVSLDNAKAREVLATPMIGLDAALDLIIANKGGKEL